MRTGLILSLGAMALIACSPTAPNHTETLTGSCVALFDADPGLKQEAFSEMPGVELDAFCSCYAGSLEGDEAALTLNTTVLTAITAAITDKGLGVEKAVQSIDSALETDANAYPFTSKEMDDIGDYLQDISRQMVDNENSCPA